MGRLVDHRAAQRRPMRHGLSHLTVLSVLLLLVTACASPAATSTPIAIAPASGPPATSTTSPTVSPDTTTGATPRPRADLSLRPLIYFGPLPPGTVHHGYDGSDDFYDLFTPDAAWPLAASRVHVFAIAASWIMNYASEDQLRQVVTDVSRRGMALALEIGPFFATSACGMGVEGFDASLDSVRRIHDVGGRVDVVSFDEPYAFGHLYDGPNACQLSIAQAAQDVADFVGQLRTIEPDLIVGDIEPLWTNLSSSDIVAWLDAYREAAGEPFAFLLLDTDWSRSDWPEASLAAEQAARDRGVPAGIIYNGGDADSDEAWNQLAVERMYAYEQVTGGRPDIVSFGSWFDHPDRALPDTDPTTFTGLINRYFSERTKVDPLAVQSPARGRLSVAGSLATQSGDPVGNASVKIGATPLDGTYQVSRLTGNVPADATSGLVVFRTNTEGAGPGQANLKIYEVGYTENGGGNKVANPSFANRMAQWAAYGEGSATTMTSDHGQGRMLLIDAAPGEALFVDSEAFDVSPGAVYDFWISASVPASSAATTYGAVIFMHGTEGQRDPLYLAPRSDELGQVTTDGSGNFSTEFGDLPLGRYLLRAAYSGDLAHWPAFADQEAQVR